MLIILESSEIKVTIRPNNVLFLYLFEYSSNLMLGSCEYKGGISRDIVVGENIIVTTVCPISR